MSGAAASTPEAPKPDAPRLPPSPCVGICTMDDGDRYCAGCGRTVDEISQWATLGDDVKRSLWRVFPERLAGLGVQIFRLAAEPDQIAAFVAASLREQAGHWSLGSFDAAVTFEPNGGLSVNEAGEVITATDAAGNGLSIKKHDRVRAFGLAGADGNGEMRAVALMLPRRRAEIEVSEAVAELGPDRDAIRQADREQLRFDLAIKQPFARASLRAGDSLVPRCRQLVGEAGGMGTANQVLASDATQSTLIFETALGRLETQSAVAAQAMDGVTVTAPGAFAVCAIFTADDSKWLAAAVAP